MTRSNKVADPTIQIVKEVLRAAFPMHKPGIDLTCRRKDHGYNIRLVYSYKEGVEPLTRDLIHQALADRLVVSKEGERAKLTLDEVRARFAVTSVMGVG